MTKVKWKVYKQLHPDEAWKVMPCPRELMIAAREKSGLSVAALAKKAGTSTDIIDRVECGFTLVHDNRTQDKAKKNLEKVAKALGIKYDDIFGKTTRGKQLVKAISKLVPIGECKGSVDDAMRYGHDNCDVGQGTIVVLPADREPPDLTKWARSQAMWRYGVKDQEILRKNMHSRNYSALIARHKETTHQTKIQDGHGNG